MANQVIWYVGQGPRTHGIIRAHIIVNGKTLCRVKIKEPIEGDVGTLKCQRCYVINANGGKDSHSLLGGHNVR